MTSQINNPAYLAYNRAVEDGYLGGNAITSNYRYNPILLHTGCCICPSFGGGGPGSRSPSRDKDGIVYLVMAIVFFVFAAFIAFGLMAKSLDKQAEYNTEAKRLEESSDETATDSTGLPTYDSQRPRDANMAQKIYKGMRNERRIAALSQGMACVGMALLVAAFVTALLTTQNSNVEIVTAVGAGLLVASGMTWVMKMIFDPMESVVKEWARYHGTQQGATATH